MGGDCKVSCIPREFLAPRGVLSLCTGLRLNGEEAVATRSDLGGRAGLLLDSTMTENGRTEPGMTGFLLGSGRGGGSLILPELSI